MLCREFDFHLAQEFFWWNPSKLPTPAEWVNVRRIRVKDAINCVWWLSPTPWPKASNRRVLIPYSNSMKGLLKDGYRAKLRPSGHDISEKFNIDNGASIPPNLIAIPNTESNSNYLRLCKEHDIKPHPARFPAELPEYFIRMLTDKGDLVFDPLAGSCVTGEVAERLQRAWICCDLVKEYLKGSLFRFETKHRAKKKVPSYGLCHPAAMWNGTDGEETLSDDGERKDLKAKRGPRKLCPLFRQPNSSMPFFTPYRNPAVPVSTCLQAQLHTPENFWFSTSKIPLHFGSIYGRSPTHQAQRPDQTLIERANRLRRIPGYC